MIRSVLILISLVVAVLSQEYRLEVREWGVLEGEYGSDLFSFQDFSFQEGVKTAVPDTVQSTETSHSCSGNRYMKPKDEKRDRELDRSIAAVRKELEKAEGKEREKLEEKLKKLMIEKIRLRIERTHVAKEPVIYFDLENVSHFSVRASFATGTPTVTYPPARIESTSCLWDSLVPADDASLNGMIHVPEKQRREILRINSVKTQPIQVDSFVTRSLFYEGDLSYQNHISWRFRGDSLTLENGGEFPVYNCYVLKDTYGAATAVAFIDTLNPGGKVTIPVTLQNLTLPGSVLEPSTKDLLINQGFHNDEAAAFRKVWDEKIIRRAEQWGSCALYQIPQSELDQLISLTITPDPTSILRTLFVLVGKEQ